MSSNVTRRSFFKGAGLAAMGALTAGTLSGCGQGYAAAAVLAMLGFARNPDMGYTDVFLYADDPAAIRLYEKLGFRGTPVREYRAFKGGLPDLYTEAKE